MHKNNNKDICIDYSRLDEIIRTLCVVKFSINHSTIETPKKGNSSVFFCGTKNAFYGHSFLCMIGDQVRMKICTDRGAGEPLSVRIECQLSIEVSACVLGHELRSYYTLVSKDAIGSLGTNVDYNVIMDTDIESSVRGELVLKEKVQFEKYEAERDVDSTLSGNVESDLVADYKEGEIDIEHSSVDAPWVNIHKNGEPFLAGFAKIFGKAVCRVWSSVCYLFTRKWLYATVSVVASIISIVVLFF